MEELSLVKQAVIHFRIEFPTETILKLLRKEYPTLPLTAEVFLAMAKGDLSKRIIAVTWEEKYD